ncbi:hypothetical protein HY409_00850 [Candidatus Gottesmanbacteria bacterium]|nr:hypothetical protein [Candidatus Gottesmanbacteria bacterium]
MVAESGVEPVRIHPEQIGHTKARIAVLGNGLAGLAAADYLQRDGYHVNIFGTPRSPLPADFHYLQHNQIEPAWRFPFQWYPRASDLDLGDPKIMAIVKASATALMELRKDNRYDTLGGKYSSLRLVDKFDLMGDGQEIPPDLKNLFKNVGGMEVEEFDVPRCEAAEILGVTHGYHFRTMAVNGSYLVSALERRFLNNHGWYDYKTIESLDQLKGKFDVVLDCMGLAAKKLFPDLPLYPVKGVELLFPYAGLDYIASAGPAIIATRPGTTKTVVSALALPPGEFQSNEPTDEEETKTIRMIDAMVAIPGVFPRLLKDEWNSVKHRAEWAERTDDIQNKVVRVSAMRPGADKFIVSASREGDMVVAHSNGWRGEGMVAFGAPSVLEAEIKTLLNLR